jgi:hypothetical protein
MCLTHYEQEGEKYHIFHNYMSIMENDRMPILCHLLNEASYENYYT